MVKKTETEQVAPPEGDVAEVEERVFKQDEVNALIDEKTKGLERAVSEKAEQIKRFESSQVDVQALRQEMTENMQLLAGLAAEGRSPESAGDLEPDERGAYIKKAQAQIAANAAKREQAEYNRKADTQWARVQKLGLTPEDDAYDDIQDLLERGKMDRATRKIDKLEPKKVEPKESDEERQKADEARALKILQEKYPHLLETDTGTPSAGGRLANLTPEELAKKIKGTDGLKWFQDHEKEIDQLYKEGKLK